MKSSVQRTAIQSVEFYLQLDSNPEAHGPKSMAVFTQVPECFICSQDYIYYNPSCSEVTLH